MYEAVVLNINKEPLLRVRVQNHSSNELRKAKEVALRNGFNPSMSGRMTDSGNPLSPKYYTFTKQNIRLLFTGKYIYKLHTAIDKTGIPVSKAFYMDGTSEVIKDRRLFNYEPDKVYKTVQGLINSL